MRRALICFLGIAAIGVLVLRILSWEQDTSLLTAPPGTDATDELIRLPPAVSVNSVLGNDGGLPDGASLEVPAVIRNDVAAAANDGDWRLDTVQLLPSVPGYEIPRILLGEEHPALDFAVEPRDVAWAVAMEAQVMAGIQVALDRIDRSASLLDVECRTTLCGAIVVLPQSQDVGTQPGDTLVYRALSSSWRINHNLEPVAAMSTGALGAIPEGSDLEGWIVYLAEMDGE